MFKGRIRGTTFTGHPTRTTGGNTLRGITYTLFVKSKVSVNAVQWNSGDDQLLYMSKKDLPSLKEGLTHYYGNELDNHSIGLGLVIREF